LNQSACSTTEFEVILPGPKAKAHHLSCHLQVYSICDKELGKLEEQAIFAQ
jgi:hypothetical protein